MSLLAFLDDVRIARRREERREQILVRAEVVDDGARLPRLATTCRDPAIGGGRRDTVAFPRTPFPKVLAGLRA
jgi:hypothetical protein